MLTKLFLVSSPGSAVRVRPAPQAAATSHSARPYVAYYKQSHRARAIARSPLTGPRSVEGAARPTSSVTFAATAPALVLQSQLLRKLTSAQSTLKAAMQTKLFWEQEAKKQARLLNRPLAFSSKFHTSTRTESYGKPADTLGAPVGHELIPMINKLQEIFSMVGTDIDLPQIVVIGGQSSGKSSVLENLVGRDFLPRGSGIVTRCPLILQLNRTSSPEEWAEFLHKPNQKFKNFDDVRKEIDAETDRKAGRNKGVSNEAILLKIYSPNVLSLTLVDTPGIARVPVGDQPIDIEEQIRGMIMNYIRKPNAIILAVTAANQDLATSDALKLARDADPEGQRTIGVLTKLDLMDKGTDAVATLLGRVLPLQHGWIGMVNRSQQDINSRKPISHALADEMTFFHNHPTYRGIADRCGTNFLAQRCSKLLTEHIRKTLPKLRSQLSEMIKKKKQELEQYGDAIVLDTNTSKGYQLLQLLNQFSADFRAAIDGIPPEIETAELNGGARIRYIFNEVFGASLNDIKATTGLTVSDIRTAIRNAAGPKPALFVPDRAFEQLVKRQIELLREPALQCTEQVHSELLRILANVESKDLMRYRRMREKIVEVATTVIRKHLKETNNMIATILKLEQFINTNHPDFVAVNVLSHLQQQAASTEKPVQARPQAQHTEEPHDGGLFNFIWGTKKEEKHTAPQAAPIQSPNRRVQEAPSTIRLDEKSIPEREKVQIDIIKSLLEAYFKIAKRNVQDMTVKTIMTVLVNTVKENLHKDLVAHLYKEEFYTALLDEDPDIALKRRVAKEELDALQKAKNIIKMSELFDM